MRRLAQRLTRNPGAGLAVTLLVANLWGACGRVSGSALGDEKGHCLPNGTCNAGLSCFSNVCVRYNGDGGLMGNDATADSSGTSGDSGTGNENTGGAEGADDAGGPGGALGSGGADGAMGGGSGAGGSAIPSCLSTVDLTSSDVNCGACGYACVHGRHCAAGRCSPAWVPLSTTGGVPTPRTRHAAGFVDGKYVVLGGAPSGTGLAMASAAGYDVATDTWSPLGALVAARCAHEVVSTGTTILTFGGLSNCMLGDATVSSLEVFTPNAGAGTWSAFAGGSPAPRYDFAATWTGKAFFIYGGANATGPAIASGALFSPSTVSWSDASCTLPGCERGAVFSAFLEGSFIRVWGGGYGNAPAGLSYDLDSAKWNAWTVPSGTDAHLAQRFADDGRRLYYLTAPSLVSIYDRKSSSWLQNDSAPMPTDFCTEGAAAWTGVELVAWSGSCGAAPVSVGARYQPPAPLP